MQRPLDGIRALDLSRVLAGPYCGQMLADMGADVLKVEGPKGDENRAWGDRTPDGLTCNFSSVNRGKKSIVLNLKDPAARDALFELVKRSDVVIQSFLPQSAERLGITFEKLKEINPDIIMCSITGYGPKGPMREKPGYDLMMQAFAGVMSATGYPEEDPVRCGVSFIDMSTGTIAYGGILTALHGRAANGACHVEVSLLRTAISMLGYHAVNWLQASRVLQPQGSGVAHVTPYQAFKCRDGLYVLAGATNDVAWRRMCTALDRPDPALDKRFGTNDGRLQNKNALLEILIALFLTKDADHWVEQLEANRVAVSLLNTIDKALTHPQVLANDILTSGSDNPSAIKNLIAPPFTLNGVAPTSRRKVPHLGQDTEEVLAGELELDYQVIAAVTKRWDTAQEHVAAVTER